MRQPLRSLTALYADKLTDNVIEDTILCGKHSGEVAPVPRIPSTPEDLPFDFRGLYFPIRLASTITIDKFQGQSLPICGLDLDEPGFLHGQSYVCCILVCRWTIDSFRSRTQGTNKGY